MGRPQYVGMGDVSSDAQALLSDLQSSGCGNYQSANTLVSNFQTSYNASPSSGGPSSLTVDGLYGAQTQAALSAATGTSAPAGCVASAGGSAPDLMIVGSGLSTTTVLLISGGVVAAGLGIWYFAAHRKK
jgi:hypothetical protein